MVLGRLWKYQLFCKASKCKFHTDTVNFLGFIIHLQGVEMEQEQVETILDWPVPKSAHDILMFLGFANFYHQFIHKYSTIATPLNDMTKGTAACAGCQKFKKGEFYNDPNFDITECALCAFEELKSKFSDAPLLIHFDPNYRISIDSDASDFAMAGVCTQLHDDGQWHPIAFWSHKLQGAEANYSTHDKELLAIVESFKHWRHYLEGSKYPIIVSSDHANLHYFMTTTELNRRQVRWVEKLAAFDFTIQHYPGSKNPIDAPSCCPDYKLAQGEDLSVDTLLLTL